MFAVVGRPKAARGGITGRLLDRIKPRAPTAGVRTAMGAEFLLIEPFEPMSGRTWRAVGRAAGELCDGAVLASGLEPPAGSSVRPFEPDGRFAALLAVNTAAALLRAAQLPSSRRVVGLIDGRGVWQELVRRLLPGCAAVVVMTDEPSRYEGFCDEVFEECGAPVLLCQSDSDLRGCAVAAAPDGLTAGQCRTLEVPVLSVRPSPAAPRAPVVSGLGLTARGELAAALPDGVEPSLFAAALYERCGARRLAGARADHGRWEGRLVEFGQMARQIARRVERQGK